MSVKWTDEQKEAIKSTEKGTVVSAAAGSGKTAVLIERIIRLLSDETKKIPADRLLAVTFTNDAAAQMRDKLDKAFEEKINADPDNKWLLSQQNLLSLAKISTINSFCLELVKDNLHLLDFQGGLKILEPAEADAITTNALNQAVENLFEKNEDDYKLIYRNFGISAKSGEGSTLNKILVQLYNFLRSQPFRNKWIESAKAKYSPEYFNETKKDLFKNAKALVNDMKINLEKFRALCNYQITVNGSQYILTETFPTAEKNLIELDELVTLCENTVNSEDIDKICNLQAKLSAVFRTKKSDKKIPDDILAKLNDNQPVMKQLKEQITDDFKAIKALFPLPEEKLIENMKEASHILEILCEIVADAENIAKEEKLEKNSLEFSDVELFAKDLLIEETDDNDYKRTPLAEEIRKSGMYKIIMIDEFQDVNNLQELIFRAISDSEDVHIMGKNLFVVGDIKQAIYQFRLTNPKLFAYCLEQAKKEENKNLLNAIYLKKNFRSRKEVIDFVNFIFRNLMSVKAGAVEYNENERLEQGAEYTERKVPTEIMLIKNYDNTQINNKRGFSDENLIIAKRIKKLIDSKAPVCKNGKDVECKASDFCVLVQTNSEIKAMSKALESVGLQAYAQDTEGYMQSREIVLVLNILRIIDNPMNDIAFAGVLLSPFKDFGFTPDELAQIKIKANEKFKEPKSIFQILSAAKSEPDTDNTDDEGAEKESEYLDLEDKNLQEKCRQAFKFMDTLRFYAMSMSMERLIRKIYDMTDLMGITSYYLDSDKKRANLRLLLEYAQSYEKNSNEGVSGFLRYIDSAENSKDAFQQAVTLTAAGDCVNVKTYHASKGLEYPYVFMCQLQRDFFGKNSGYIYIDNEAGAAFKLADKPGHIDKVNPYYNILEKICKDEQRSEKMRLMYVGATRAKEKLFVSYAVKLDKNQTFEQKIAKQKALSEKVADMEKITPEAVLSCNDMLCWMTLALTKFPGNQQFLEHLGYNDEEMNSVITDSQSSIPDVEFRSFEISETENEESEKEEKNVIETNSRLEKELNKKFAFEYDKTASVQPSKLTVTEIVNEEKEREMGEKNPEFYPNLPRLDDELDKLSNAEKGTFTHKFMELADYSNAEKSVDDALDRLVKEGYFTKKEASGVYKKSLEKFFRSDFYKRMKNSDRIFREKKFLVSMKDLNLEEKYRNITGNDGMIQGIADCIFKENDGYVIVDYKTDHFADKSEMYKYTTQLAIYKSAFEIILGEKIKSCYIYSFWLGEGEEIKL